jgi:hypothetical protein
MEIALTTTTTIIIIIITYLVGSLRAQWPIMKLAQRK